MPVFRLVSFVVQDNAAFDLSGRQIAHARHRGLPSEDGDPSYGNFSILNGFRLKHLGSYLGSS